MDKEILGWIIRTLIPVAVNNRHIFHCTFIYLHVEWLVEFSIVLTIKIEHAVLVLKNCSCLKYITSNSCMLYFYINQ